MDSSAANDTTAIKAIPATYKGILFRSRTEARWAVFFDALGVRWEYEHEGYQLPSGWYVPDFWLPEVSGGCFVEIKPEREPTSREHAACLDLSRATGTRVYLFAGSPKCRRLTADHDCEKDGCWIHVEGYEPMLFCCRGVQFVEGATPFAWKNTSAVQSWRYLAGDRREVDRHHEWCACPCGRIGIEWAARYDRVCGPFAPCFPRGVDDPGWREAIGAIGDELRTGEVAPDPRANADWEVIRECLCWPEYVTSPVRHNVAAWNECAESLRRNTARVRDAVEASRRMRFW